MRISVSHHATTFDDVGRSVEAILAQVNHRAAGEDAARRARSVAHR